jgi:hypothetical protein
MADNGIVALEIESTAGSYVTLWAPGWVAGGEQWQAFLGDDSGVFGFPSPAALLAWLRDNGRGTHDLSDHPRWSAFLENAERKVTPRASGKISFIDLPDKLAGRPSFENTKAVAAAFDVLRSLGAVCGIDKVNRWFRSYSVLANVARGADHYSGDNGLSEWSSVGHAVLGNWPELLDAVDEQFVTPEVPEDAVSRAQSDIEDAEKAKKEAAEKAATAAAEDRAQADEAGKAAVPGADDADPYDSTAWAAAGIDPVRVTVDGSTVYTLRCYVGDRQPVFLGTNGEIHTFPSARSLVRWMIDAKDHDLAQFGTWDDLVSLANAGELEVEVHPSNVYGFTGLREDIAKGVDAVDTDQLGRAYELLADAADWAKDDGVNQVLLAYPRLQDYIAYMLGSPSAATPTAPFDEEANGWTELENNLTRRFTKF